MIPADRLMAKSPYNAYRGQKYGYDREVNLASSPSMKTTAKTEVMYDHPIICFLIGKL